MAAAREKPRRRDVGKMNGQWRKLGQVIAERHFEITSRKKAVVLRIAAPRRHLKDWACRFEIEGVVDAEVIRREAYGVDSVQALTLCLEMVKVELRTIRAHSGLTWLGIQASPDDLGLLNPQ